MNPSAKPVPIILLSIKYSNNDNNNHEFSPQIFNKLTLYDLYNLWQTMTPKMSASISVLSTNPKHPMACC